MHASMHAYCAELNCTVLYGSVPYRTVLQKSVRVHVWHLRNYTRYSSTYMYFDVFRNFVCM